MCNVSRGLAPCFPQSILIECHFHGPIVLDRDVVAINVPKECINLPALAKFREKGIQIKHFDAPAPQLYSYNRGY